MSGELWHRLMSSKGQCELVTFDGGTHQSHTWDALRPAGETAASGLRSLGLQRGTPVAMVLTNSYSVCATVLAVWMCGGVVVSLPLRGRGQRSEEYGTALGRMAQQAGADLLLVEQELAQDLPAEKLGGMGVEVVPCDGLRGGPLQQPHFPGDDEVVFVQYSSGTTAEPRGCRLTASAIDAQLKGLAEALSLDSATDRGAMWLPLSHDMGFFGGVLLFWSFGLPGLLSSPSRFLVSPRGWLDDCAKFGATLTVAPNFALDLAARAVARRGPSSRLSLRACIIGGEEVQATTLRRAADALAPYGLPREALTPAYGLAEATLAVTVGDAAATPSVANVDSTALANGLATLVSSSEGPTSEVVSVGRPIRDTEVTLEGNGEVGEIVVRSPSLASGYVGQPAAEAERFRDGSLRTGDLGFLANDELYVIGRLDDVLVVAGENFDARRLDQVLGAHPEVRPGNAAVVARHEGGQPKLVAYVEPRDPTVEPNRLVRELARSLNAIGPAPVEEWFLLRRGRLPKTPSGKMQRFRLRQHAPDGSDIIATVITR